MADETCHLQQEPNFISKNVVQYKVNNLIGDEMVALYGMNVLFSKTKDYSQMLSTQRCGGQCQLRSQSDVAALKEPAMLACTQRCKMIL